MATLNNCSSVEIRQLREVIQEDLKNCAYLQDAAQGNARRSFLQPVELHTEAVLEALGQALADGVLAAPELLGALQDDLAIRDKLLRSPGTLAVAELGDSVPG